MTTLYLIAHKVRGEPAFDVAHHIDCSECFGRGRVPGYECVECDGLGYWWIIPTSGHRAYPYWSERFNVIEGLGLGFTEALHDDMPTSLPDHYATKASPSQPTPAEGYYLIAHAVNVISIDRVQIELEVASESIDGRWYTNSGMEVWPFWKQPIEFPTPELPEGWIEHIQQLADKLKPPTQPLTNLLGLAKPAKPSTPFARRI